MRSMQNHSTGRLHLSQGGFTLAEVVLAMFIMAASVLGVAAMQMMSLQANRGAFHRTQAIQIGSEILDAMRANPRQLAAYAGVSYNSASTNFPSDPGCATNATGCTQADMVSVDLRQWATHFVNVFGVADYRPTLPNGVGAVTANGDVYSVTITWDQQLFQDDGSGNAERVAATDTITLTSAITP